MDRFGAASGIPFAILVFVGLALAGDIDEDLEPSSPSADIAREYLDRNDEMEAGSLLALIGLLAFFLFLPYLHRHLRKAEGEDGWLASMAYVGGSVFVAVALGAIALSFARSAIDQAADAETAKTLLIIDWNYVWLFSPPMIALTLSTSLIALSHQALPRWLAWIGLVVALFELMPWIEVFIFLGWTLLTSLVLLLKTTSWEKNVR